MSSNKMKSCYGKDVFSRMNFLYQASVLMANKNNTLSAYYGNLCKTIGKRSVLRLDPNIKRTLCKRCGIAFKPDKTVDIEFIEPESDDKNVEKRMLMKCKKCGNIRSYLYDNPRYKFWLENPESIVETYEFDKNMMENEKLKNSNPNPNPNPNNKKRDRKKMNDLTQKCT